MRRSTTCLAGLTLIAALAVPFRASPLARADTAMQLTAQQIAAACAEQSQLAEELGNLQARQALLRQIVANYGFTNTVAEFDAASTFLTERDRATRPKPPMKQLYEDSLSAAKGDLQAYITGLQRTPDAIGGVTPQFLQMIRAAPMPQALRDQILRLASDPATRLRGYGIALDWVDKFTLPLELMEAAEDGPAHLAWKGFMEAVSVVAPSYGALLKVVDWAGNNLYNAVTGQWTAYQIRMLTTSTEADLVTLKQRTEELKVIAQKLALINARSPVLAQQCDSTRLIRAQPDSAPATSAARKGGGSGANALLLTTALAGGASLAALKYLKPKDCGEAPLDEYYNTCPGPGCSSVRARYEEWCICNKYIGFDGNGCY